MIDNSRFLFCKELFLVNVTKYAACCAKHIILIHPKLKNTTNLRFVWNWLRWFWIEFLFWTFFFFIHICSSPFFKIINFSKSEEFCWFWGFDQTLQQVHLKKGVHILCRYQSVQIKKWIDPIFADFCGFLCLYSITFPKTYTVIHWVAKIAVS